jgi:hypothetical protein
MVLKTIKVRLCASLMASFVFGCFLHQTGLCAEPVNVKDGLLSVNLKDHSLLEVARDIEKQSGVWFRGDENLFQEKISVTFNALPIEEGLKRILTNLNYSLMFDAKNNVAGVLVMGEGKPAGVQASRAGVQPSRAATQSGARTRPAPAVRTGSSVSTPVPAANVRRPPRVLPQRPQSGTRPLSPRSVPGQSAPPQDALGSQENEPSADDPSASDGPLPPAFRGRESAPSPVGPVADKETPDVPRVIRNAPPPAGTSQGNAPSPGDSKPTATPTEDTTKGDTTP